MQMDKMMTCNSIRRFEGSPERSRPDKFVVGFGSKREFEDGLNMICSEEEASRFKVGESYTVGVSE